MTARAHTFLVDRGGRNVASYELDRHPIALISVRRTGFMHWRWEASSLRLIRTRGDQQIAAPDRLLGSGAGYFRAQAVLHARQVAVRLGPLLTPRRVP